MSPLPKSSKVKKEEVEEVTQPASVYVEKSVTKNLGDYNSCKITVGVTLPVDPTKELLKAVEHAVEVAVQLVDKRLEHEVDLLTE